MIETDRNRDRKRCNGETHTWTEGQRQRNEEHRDREVEVKGERAHLLLVNGDFQILNKLSVHTALRPHITSHTDLLSMVIKCTLGIY